MTTCRHVAFCTSGCCSPVPAEGAAPSPHPAVIATAQGLHQAGCWRLWLRAQPPTAAPRPRQATASVPRMAYEPAATAEEMQGDLHVSFETSLPQGVALVGLETQAVTWPLPLADRRRLSPSHHMRGHFLSCFDQASQRHCGQKEDETGLGTTSAGESHRGYLKRFGPPHLHILSEGHVPPCTQCPSHGEAGEQTTGALLYQPKPFQSR